MFIDKLCFPDYDLAVYALNNTISHHVGQPCTVFYNINSTGVFDGSDPKNVNYISTIGVGNGKGPNFDIVGDDRVGPWNVNQIAGGWVPGDVVPYQSELKDVVQKILYAYKVGVLSGTFSYDKGSPLEVGNTLTMGNLSLSWTMDSENRAPQNIISSASYQTGFVPGSTSTSCIIPWTGSTLRYDAPTTLSWSSYGQSEWTDIGGSKLYNTNSISYSTQWLNATLFGASNSSVLDNNLLLSLQQKVLDSNKTYTFYCGNDHNNTGFYTYIAYPSVYGALSSVIQDGALPVLGAFTKQPDMVYTNSFGVSVNYYVYKSNADKAFSTNAKIDIS